MTTIYGDKGNRWWVGLNIGTSGVELGSSGSIGGLAPSGYESLPSGNAADDKQFAAAAAIDKGGNPPARGISVENILWYNINGPYPTQKAANAAIPAIQKAHPAPGELAQAIDAASGNPASGNPVGWTQALANFLNELENSGTWVRVAKVVIGGVLVIVGLAKLTGAGDAVADVAKKGLGVW